MTKYVIEADGEIIGETLDQGMAEAMFDAAATVYDAVTMYREGIQTCQEPRSPAKAMGALTDYYLSLQKSAEEAPSFAEVRRQRELAKTLEEQQLLALEDRRAFAREYTQARPVVGPFSMMLLAPAEQVYKGAQHLRGKEIGRSGFFAPLANIGAAYQGALEGLATRGEK